MPLENGPELKPFAGGSCNSWSAPSAARLQFLRGRLTRSGA